MNDDETRAKCLAAFEVVRRDAYKKLYALKPEGSSGVDVEELIEAIAADPRIEALKDDPVTGPYLLGSGLGIIREREPDLLKAAQAGYPGALERLGQKMKTLFKRVSAGLAEL